MQMCQRLRRLQLQRQPQRRRVTTTRPWSYATCSFRAWRPPSSSSSSSAAPWEPSRGTAAAPLPPPPLPLRTTARHCSRRTALFISRTIGEESCCRIRTQWRRQDFVIGGSDVWVYRRSRVRSPPVPVVLSVYQRGSLLDGLAMYLSCDTKKFHDDERTRTYHIISDVHPPGGSFPPSPSWRRHCTDPHTTYIDRWCSSLL